MNTSYRPSFLALIATLFVAPLFFVPGGILDLGNAKPFIIVLGLGIAAILFLVEFMRKREVALPRHHLLSAALLLPVVYLLSALLTTPSSLSLLGYNLEVGTFGSILLGVMALFLAAVTFADTARSLQAILALFGSFGLLALFMAVKVIGGGNLLVLGNFSGTMGNPLGSWVDLAVAFGLLATLSMLVLGMLPMKGIFKVAGWASFLVATALLAILHYEAVFALTLVASLSAFFYFLKVESAFHFSRASGEREGLFSSPKLAPIILGVVSLVFLVNPLISTDRSIGALVSEKTGVANSDIRPTLSTTLSISKAVLTQRSLFGSGPNTFVHDWSSFKPSDVNATPYWAIAFPFGASFMATQVATTGIVGSILWLAFFALLIVLVLKAVSHIPESRASRFAFVSSLVTTLFLWTATFLYVPSFAMLLIAFLFTGVFLALGREAGFVPVRTLTFPHAPLKQAALLIALLAMVGVLYLGWSEAERALGAFHYAQAVKAANTEGASIDAVEAELMQAIKFAPLDAYYSAVAQLNFSRAQAVAAATTGTKEENQAAFEQALGRAITASRAAVDANPANYQNWVALGNTYSALVPAPLKIEGAYESAQQAYNEAFRRNPSNPELPLLLARLELNKGDADTARSYIRSALALKQDYPDAYLLLAQLEVSEKNLPAALASAEKLAQLLPDNVGAQFELGLLKFSAEDYQGAADAFGAALKLSPDYANAKYYLALSYAKLGRTDEALMKLQELKVANPENADLDAAIESLTKPAGKK
jgi:cytochrome c-type biogenesis protein CcmH/NrfG